MLRGKYANLPVDKVVAVARAGLAKTARAAAEKARIETLTLEEATSADWHLIAELPEEALIVTHFPVVENVSLHLVKGQDPWPEIVGQRGCEWACSSMSWPTSPRRVSAEARRVRDRETGFTR
jgi:hypothetical protein